jgi:hypothetical protein
MKTKKRRKKNDKAHCPVIKTKARCGHVSKQGRYFKCEKCLKYLPSDDGDLTYFSSTDEDE